MPNKFKQSPFAWLTKKINESYPVTLLGNEFRLSERTPPFPGALLAYGTNTTLSKLTSLHGSTIQGFGERLTLSAVTGEDLHTPDMIHKILREHLSLGQKGCLSARGLIILDPDQLLSAKIIQDALLSVENHAPQSIWYEQKRAYWQHLLEGADLRQDGVLIAVYQNPDHPRTAEAPYTIPVSWYTSPLNLAEILEPHTKLSASPSLLASGLKASPLGTIQAPRWDGTHDGKPLFCS